jgi:hypothetical protein
VPLCILLIIVRSGHAVWGQKNHRSCPRTAGPERKPIKHLNSTGRNGQSAAGQPFAHVLFHGRLSSPQPVKCLVNVKRQGSPPHALGTPCNDKTKCSACSNPRGCLVKTTHPAHPAFKLKQTTRQGFSPPPSCPCREMMLRTLKFLHPSTFRGSNDFYGAQP